MVTGLTARSRKEISSNGILPHASHIAATGLATGGRAAIAQTHVPRVGRAAGYGRRRPIVTGREVELIRGFLAPNAVRIRLQ